MKLRKNGPHFFCPIECILRMRGGVIDWWWSIITIQQCYCSVTPSNKGISLQADNKVEGLSLHQQFSPEGFLSKFSPNTNLMKNFQISPRRTNRFCTFEKISTSRPSRHGRKLKETNSQSRDKLDVIHDLA